MVWTGCFLDLGALALFLDLYMFIGPARIFFGTWGEENCGRRACVFSGPCGDIFFDLVFVLDLGEFLSTAKLIVFEPGFFFSRMRVAKGACFTSGVWAGG